MPGQVVEGTVRLLVCCQHLGIDYNLRQFGAARFCLRSPVVGQLTPPAPSRTGHCQSKRQNNPHDPGLLAERVSEGQRCAPTHKMMLMDQVTEKVQLQSQRILPTTPIQLSFSLHEFRHVCNQQSTTVEQISLMTLSCPQDTIGANAGSVLTHSRLLQKNQRNFFLYLILEEVQFLRAFRPACESSKIIGGKLTNKGTTSRQ